KDPLLELNNYSFWQVQWWLILFQLPILEFLLFHLFGAVLFSQTTMRSRLTKGGVVILLFVLSISATFFSIWSTIQAFDKTSTSKGNKIIVITDPKLNALFLF